MVDPGAAEAVLSILGLRRQGLSVPDEAWNRLFDSNGYRRLGERKEAMNRPFDRESFRSFVLSPEVASREAALRKTLKRWGQVDLGALAGRVLAYLPEGASMRATVYPMIKPRTNSFVFDLTGEPAIFLYLDPEVSPEQFANTVLHELHHIGFGGSCPPPAAAEEIEALALGPKKVLRWSGAFGEGFAMLAAAGGSEFHPHAVSPEGDRQRWDTDMARVSEDRELVEAFFLELLAGSLSEEQELEKARSFYGIQGPWYTVGWKMAATIEEALGQDALIKSFCDPRLLLSTFNRAAGGQRASRAGTGELWSAELLAAVQGES